MVDFAALFRWQVFLQSVQLRGNRICGAVNDVLQQSVGGHTKDICFMHAFYSTACVSTHAVVLCDMNGRQMPLSPAPTSSSVPLGLIRRG